MTLKSGTARVALVAVMPGGCTITGVTRPSDAAALPDMGRPSDEEPVLT